MLDLNNTRPKGLALYLISALARGNDSDEIERLLANNVHDACG